MSFMIHKQYEANIFTTRLDIFKIHQSSYQDSGFRKWEEHWNEWAAVSEFLCHCLKHSCVSFNPNSPLDLAAQSAYRVRSAHHGNEVALVNECHFKPWKLVSPCPLHLQYGWLISRGVCMHNVTSPLSMFEYTVPIFCLWHRLISHQLQSHSHRCLVAQLAHNLRMGDGQISIKKNKNDNSRAGTRLV